MANVTFSIRASLRDSQRIFVVGSISTLGFWSPLQGLELAPLPGRVGDYTASTTIPGNQRIEYKYAIVDGVSDVIWEESPFINRLVDDHSVSTSFQDEWVQTREQAENLLATHPNRFVTATTTASTVGSTSSVMNIPTDLQLRFERIRECADQYQRSVNKVISDAQLASANARDETTEDAALMARCLAAESTVSSLEAKVHMYSRYATAHGPAAEGDAKTVRLFLTDKVDPNAVDSQGMTALHMACRNGHVDVAEELLLAGAEINRAMDSGLTPLSLALEYDRSELVSWLRRKGGVEGTGNDQLTAQLI